MEPSERNTNDDVLAPAWEGDPRVRRALSEAVAPPENGVVESRVALARLWERVGEPLRGRGYDRLGNGTLRRCGIGAAVVFVLGIAGMIFHESQSIVPSSTIQIYRTRPGQRMTARLLDGSTMVLAPASSAAVTARGIDVIGEAYFAVVPHTAHPFVVRTQNATMQVLGTRFSVRQYPEEFQSRVVVDDGRVAVSLRRASQNGNAHTGNAHTVVASRMLAVISDSSVSVSSEITSRDYTSWTHGILVFDHVALRDVVTELARAYGVPITIPDTILAAKSVGIEVSVTNDPLSLVLETLCGVVDAHYVRAAHSYVLSPGRVPSKSRSTVFPRYSLPQPEQQYGK